MSVVLLILKIIGIILLVLLGLLLLAVLSALLVPARYRFEGEFREKASFRAKVSWFFSVFSFRVEYDGELKQKFRIFGIPIRLPTGHAEEYTEGSLMAQELSEASGAEEEAGEEKSASGKIAAKEQRAEEASGKTAVMRLSAEKASGKTVVKEQQGEALQRAEREEAKAVSEFQTDSEEAFMRELEAGFQKNAQARGRSEDAALQAAELLDPEQDGSEESFPGAGLSEEPSGPSEERFELPEETTESSEEQFSEESASPRRRKKPRFLFFQKLKHFFGMIKTKWETLKETPRRLCRKFRQMQAKFRTLRQKVRWGRMELKRKENREAAAAVFRELKYLLKHVSPRKVKGEIAFGTDDPALTGQILGAISVLPFFYRYRISVMPDFAAEQYYLEGELMIKGHARMIHVLVSGFRLLKNRNIRSLIRRYRNS